MEIMQLSLVSWPLLLVLLLPLVCLLYLGQDPSSKQQQPRASDNDLKAYPIVGRFPHLAKNGHRLVEWSVEVAKRSPTTRTMAFKAPGLPGVVITANPDNVEHIAKTSFANSPKGDFLPSKLEDFLGHGIFNFDGEQWLWRKAASVEFSKRSLRKFILYSVQSEVVGRLLPLLEQAERHGRTLDMQHVFECFTFDNICHVAFGEDPGLLELTTVVICKV